MKFTACFAATLTLLLAAFATMGTAAAQHTPEAALRALQDGNRRFASDQSQVQPLGDGVRRTLARGQSPFAIVLCCADSHVPPEHLFNVGLGELFVLRSAGHAIDAETLAGLEHAVERLNAPLCVVLAHEGCATVGRALARRLPGGQRGGDSEAMRQLLEQLEPAVRKVDGRDLGGAALATACEEEHAHLTVAECMRRSAVLRRFAAVGKFQIVAARLHQRSGEVEWLPTRPLPAAAEAPATGPDAVPPSTPPHVALRLLQAGHRRFLSDAKPTADLSAARRDALALGQNPPVVVLTCSDSRLTPEHLFDAGLGELFVVRSPGASLTDNALASIEHATGTLGASLLLVLGHEHCELLQAAAERPEAASMSPHRRQLLQRLEAAIAASRAANGARVDGPRAMSLRTLAEARSRSALLRRLETTGRLAMLAAVYDVSSGDLSWLKEESAAVAGGEGPPHDPHAVAAAEPRSTVAVPSHHEVAAHGQSHAPAAEHDEHGATHRSGTAHGGEGAHGEHVVPGGSAHGATGGAAQLPVVDWPAPLGESKPAHPAAPADEHAAASAASDPHAHGSEHAPAAEHGHEPTHGTKHVVADHHGDDHGSARDEPHATAGGHGEVAAKTADQRSPTNGEVRWQDPIVLVGISGVMSLLLAAVMALKR